MQVPGEMNRRQFVAAAGATIALPTQSAAARTEAWPATQALLDSYVADKAFAGIAAAVVDRGGQPAFVVAGKLAYGAASRIDPDSLFRLYSVTKPVTGIAAMLLIEDGTIALDQPVAEILPELRSMRVAIDPDRGLESRPAVRQMTIRHLLTHTSGLSNWQPVLGDPPITRAYRERGITPGSFVRQPGESWYTEQVDSLAAMIARMSEVPLIAEPGTTWHYSMGLDVMGAVIERVSRMSLDSFMRRRIFAPLGMRSTGFQVAPRDARRLTTLYAKGPGGPVPIDRGNDSVWLRPPRLVAGGGGLVSSARDLIRIGQMMVNGGALSGRRVMRPETIRLALSNLLPPGVSYPPTGGFGAGAGVVMPGVRSDNGSEGVFSSVGASSTFFSVDPLRQRASLFLAQYMPGRSVPMPEALRYRAAFLVAIDDDLQHRRAA
jgi:CubicO group peptidase (beta-lactamase class C family)